VAIPFRQMPYGTFGQASLSITADVVTVVVSGRGRLGNQSSDPGPWNNLWVFNRCSSRESYVQLRKPSSMRSPERHATKRPLQHGKAWRTLLMVDVRALPTAIRIPFGLLVGSVCRSRLQTG
jgi:hypothetical protein